MFRRKFPFYHQFDRMDCGPTCLRMIARYYGKELDLEYLRQICYLNKDGVNLLNLSEAAEKIGFRTLKVQIGFDKLVATCPLPCILHWNQEHYVVLYKRTVSGKGTGAVSRLYIADPAHGLIDLDQQTFVKTWCGGISEKGIVLVVTPHEDFSAEHHPGNRSHKGSNLKFVWQYIRPHRKLMAQLILGVFLGSCISLCFPFLTQILVDLGIGRKDFNLIFLILFSQLFLFAGEMVVQLVRTWILLNVNSRISISVISDFLKKLMELPANFFEIKSTGDITQRIQDHGKIEAFLTGTALNTLFSVTNIIVVSFILLLYNKLIFTIFFVMSALSVLWIVFFLRRRKLLDYKRFLLLSMSQDALYEIIFGIQDIKLNGGELSKRWEWERIQVRQFKWNIKSLSLAQYQRIGFSFINQLKNILTSFVAAQVVIEGSMSLGMMLSISYIIGLANGPLEQLIEFFRQGQDASLSLARLREIHDKEREEQDNGGLAYQASGKYTRSAPAISIHNLSFRYGGPKSPLVLDDITVDIPKGKVTAIVGTSGSGKTTLMKLLLKFYAPTEGKILVNGESLNDISAKAWRRNCGSVIQNGYIFSDSIARNIAMEGVSIDPARMESVIDVANIDEYIQSLPLKYNTRLSSSSGGMSQGQKQRILIARALYRNPDFLLFDEATSSLDANNERAVMTNLEKSFQGKTVVIIAHRLSTVRHADQILVLEKGQLVETGSHECLIKKQGQYYKLIKNQLELGQ